MPLDYPPFSFPPSVYPRGETREVFAHYGCYGHVCSDDKGEVTCQNLKTDQSIGFSAVHPVLPLAAKPEKVLYPWLDRVMGEILDTNKKIKTFIQHTRLRQNWCKKKISLANNLSTLKTEASNWRADPFKDEEDFLNGLDVKLRKHLTSYINLSNVDYVRYNNSQYAGGCLGHIEGLNSDTYLVSPGGHKFDTLKVRRISEEAEGLLRCSTVLTHPLPQTLYEVDCRRVQGQGLIAVRGQSSCFFFGVEPDSQDSVFKELHQIDKPGTTLTSVQLSPYIPGECLLTTEGACHMWTNGNLEMVYGPAPPRFPVSDRWCSAHYGSHPRQVVYTDLCAVQLMDLRARNPEAIDLFALPNHGLHKRERVRLSQPHPTSSFFHTVATDYSLLLLDERFVKNPVLQWDHMLPTPPQYLSSLSYDSPGLTYALTYVASQFPADVHGFKFNVNMGITPPQRVMTPWRAAQMSDLSKWKQFIENCANPYLLRNRVNASLAGIDSVKWGNGHAVFQLNCHGEIFHQVFKASSSDQDVTFAAGLGSHDLHPLPVAAQRAKAWIASWEKHTRSNSRHGGEVLEADLSTVSRCMITSAQPDPACHLCNPDNKTTSLESSTTQATNNNCAVCQMTILEGRLLSQNLNEDEVTTAVGKIPTFFFDLEDPESLPSTSSLSRLLLKRWQKDDDIEHILKDRDKEVIKQWKERQAARKDEQNQVDRILGKSQAQGSSGGHVASEGSVIDFDSIVGSSETVRGEPDTEISRVPGQEVRSWITEQRAQSRAPAQSLTGGIASGTSVGSGSSKQKKKKKKHKKQKEAATDDRDTLSQGLTPSALGSSVSLSPGQSSVQGSVGQDSAMSLFSSPMAEISGKLKKTAQAYSDRTPSIFSTPENSQQCKAVSSPASGRKRKRRSSNETASTKLSYTPQMASNILSFSLLGNSSQAVRATESDEGIQDSLNEQGPHHEPSEMLTARRIDMSQTELSQSPRKKHMHSLKKKTYTAGF